ncbi:hypothetical protein BHM03_00017334 [Ensete ventricosum]|nr:hypothetical protein BHM03_00017334 [Ensete ventricosum]
MAVWIVRRSINAFFDGYQSFTSIAALLVFPVSASVLLSQAVIPFATPPLLETISLRLWSLFQAARFPASAGFFSLLNVKLAQTVFTFVSTLPLVLTFLLLAKASVVHVVCEGRDPRRKRGPPPLSSFLPLYRSILPTHLFNSFVVLSANASTFALLFLVFNAVDVLGLSTSNVVLCLSAAGAVLYSVVVANTTVICNLAIVVSATDNCSGYLPVLKACLLIRGRVMTALGLALPANLGMAAVEALFQYRVVRQYNLSGELNSSLFWEAFSITYFHALIVVLDVIMTCMFFKICRTDCHPDWEKVHEHHGEELEPEDKMGPRFGAVRTFRGEPHLTRPRSLTWLGAVAPRKPRETARWVRVPPRRQHGDQRHLIRRKSHGGRTCHPSDHTLWRDALFGPPNQRSTVGPAHLLVLANAKSRHDVPSGHTSL